MTLDAHGLEEAGTTLCVAGDLLGLLGAWAVVMVMVVSCHFECEMLLKRVLDFKIIYIY